MFGGAGGEWGVVMVFPQERCSKWERRLEAKVGWGGLRLGKD